MTRPLLMIPGPIEISEGVLEATRIRPPSHVAPDLIAAFGEALEGVRSVWLASDAAMPFVVAGGGTLAMEAAAHNVVEPGDTAVVVNTGYFGDRMAEMLRRRGVTVATVGAAPGDAPPLADVAAALELHRPKAMFVTHVDTSTGVRTDARALATLAREHEVLSVFDGVCATAAERFEMEAWGADVYLTSSQKAIGLPAGLALWVAGPRALAARAAMQVPPPMLLDQQQWQPIMEAYLARRGSYFSTPATTLVWALRTGLAEILESGMEARFQQHQRAADAMRAAWSHLGLELLPARPELAANTLSAIRYPQGVDSSVVGRIKAHGVIVAGGLHPEIKHTYFRVGHMGVVTGRPEALVRTVRAVGKALVDVGHACDVDGAADAAAAVVG